MTGLLEPTIAIDYADLRGELNTHAFYTFSVVPSGTTWRISAIEQRVLWNEGDPSIHRGASARGA